jgi:threonylcarbamoyladenosine tRNA methylthiotransferase MtaB
MSLEVVTFGCRLNIYESELIKKSAAEAGLTNTIIFNSCAVTKEAERQLRQAIRRARKHNPDAKIVVTGCAAQITPEFYASMPEVDAVLGNDEKTKSHSYQELMLNPTECIKVNDIMSIKETASQLIEGVDNLSRAFLQVQNGCDHRCTYCIIPYGRGNSRSVPIGEIVLQTKKMVEAGYKEIVLTGVDITDYGLDLPGKPKLGQMVKRLLSNVPGLPRLRLSSIDVAEIDDELFELITTHPRLMPHLHLSLQSGDNMILKRMKRRHNRTQVIEFCNKVRSLRPEIVFGADIIAGFPTETDEMFANTLRIVEEAGLTYLHVFPYSEREGTPAERMPQVDLKIRKARAKQLRELGGAQVLKLNTSHIGKTISIIVESDGIGRAPDFSQVKLSESIDAKHGDIIEVTIRSANEKYLFV